MFQRLGLRLDHGSSLIEAATRTDSVGQHKLRAVGTLHEVHRRQFLVSSSFVSPRAGHTFLWHRHGISFSILSVCVQSRYTHGLAFQAPCRFGPLGLNFTPAAAVTRSGGYVRGRLRIHSAILSFRRASASHLGSTGPSSGQVHSLDPFNAPQCGHRPGQSSLHKGFMGTFRRSS